MADEERQPVGKWLRDYWNAELLFAGSGDLLMATGKVDRSREVFFLDYVDVPHELRSRVLPEELALRLHQRIAPQYVPVMRCVIDEEDQLLKCTLETSHGWSTNIL